MKLLDEKFATLNAKPANRQVGWVGWGWFRGWCARCRCSCAAASRVWVVFFCWLALLVVVDANCCVPGCCCKQMPRALQSRQVLSCVFSPAIFDVIIPIYSVLRAMFFCSFVATSTRSSGRGVLVTAAVHQVSRICHGVKCCLCSPCT